MKLCIRRISLVDYKLFFRFIQVWEIVSTTHFYCLIINFLTSTCRTSLILACLCLSCRMLYLTIHLLSVLCFTKGRENFEEFAVFVICFWLIFHLKIFFLVSTWSIEIWVHVLYLALSPTFLVLLSLSLKSFRWATSTYLSIPEKYFAYH